MNWKCAATITGYHSRSIYSVKWSNLTGLIATACSDNSIHVFKESNSVSADAAVISDEPYLKLLSNNENAHSQDVNCVDWSPKEGSLLASCSDDGSVKIWKFTESD